MSLREEAINAFLKMEAERQEAEAEDRRYREKATRAGFQRWFDREPDSVDGSVAISGDVRLLSVIAFSDPLGRAGGPGWRVGWTCFQCGVSFWSDTCYTLAEIGEVLYNTSRLCGRCKTCPHSMTAEEPVTAEEPMTAEE